MEFEIDQSRFLAALGLAQTVADKRSNTQPILANVLLRATKDNKLVCSATDMMISVTETIPVEVKTPGALTLGVRYLHNVVRTLPSKPLRIKGLDNHWAQVIVGRSEFKLMGQAPGDFLAGGQARQQQGVGRAGGTGQGVAPAGHKFG